MRFAGHFLGNAERLRLGVLPIHGNHAIVRIEYSDQRYARSLIYLDLFVDLCDGVIGRENLHGKGWHAIDQRRLLRLVNHDIGGYVDDIDADHRIGIVAEANTDFAPEYLTTRCRLLVEPIIEELPHANHRATMKSVAYCHWAFP